MEKYNLQKNTHQTIEQNQLQDHSLLHRYKIILMNAFFADGNITPQRNRQQNTRQNSGLEKHTTFTVSKLLKNSNKQTFDVFKYLSF